MAAANPLRDPRDKRIPRVAGPCVLVLFGVTGDLARKKLLPAIYDLANRGLLPPGFSLVGSPAVTGRTRTSPRSPTRRQGARADAVPRGGLEAAAEGIHFVPGEFTDDGAFDALAMTLKEIDETRGTGGNYGFYLSVPPKFFPLVVEQLKRTGLSEPPPGRWRRVVIEKPFGHDLKSAQELNAITSSVFPESSVFRIDHYLGKETVQNILALRFANNLFEPIWNRGYVDHVQITISKWL